MYNSSKVPTKYEGVDANNISRGQRQKKNRWPHNEGRTLAAPHLMPAGALGARYALCGHLLCFGAFAWAYVIYIYIYIYIYICTKQIRIHNANMDTDRDKDTLWITLQTYYAYFNHFARNLSFLRLGGLCQSLLFIPVYEYINIYWIYSFNLFSSLSAHKGFVSHSIHIYM